MQENEEVKIPKRRGWKPRESKDDTDVVDNNGLGGKRKCHEIASSGVNYFFVNLFILT